MAFRFFAGAMMLLAFAGARAADAQPPRSPEYEAALERITRPGGEDQFGSAVEIRRRGGFDETRAKIAVRRDLAALYAQRQQWANAAAQTTVAVTLAEVLGDPELYLGALLEHARHLKESNDPKRVFEALDRASRIVAALDRPGGLIEPLLLRAELYFELQMGKEKEEAYAHLLSLPDVDKFRVELHRARHTKIDKLGTPYADQWERVLALAREAGRQDVAAEAHDALGLAAARSVQHAEAARHFAAADAAGPPPGRSTLVWMQIIESNTAVDRRPDARAAIDKVFSLIDPEKEPGRASALFEARGELLGRDGDFASAYRDLRTASQLRGRHNATRQSFPMVRIAPTISHSEQAAAASLAAVESAFREAELDRARLRQRQTAGMAVTAGLAAALLGLAYAYKRRSAAALATARDNAELRADRTHWQMLRYQLNPHFLFNALASLGGLVATNPPAASRTIERLSEFCQLALKGASEDLRPLARELEIIRAYLDVEQAGAGEDLQVRYEIEPAALPCLIPPLLLQPLVENALKYGAQTSEERLDVVLTARVDSTDHRLTLEVANSGRWIEPDGQPRPRESIGLANVRERLRRFGDAAADLTLTHDGHWVRARLCLPARPAAPDSRTP